MSDLSSNRKSPREATRLVSRVVGGGAARGLRKVSVMDSECEPFLPRGCTALVREAREDQLRKGCLVMLRCGQWLYARQVSRFHRGTPYAAAPGDTELDERIDPAHLVGEVVGFEFRGQRHLFELTEEPAWSLVSMLQKLGFRPRSA